MPDSQVESLPLPWVHNLTVSETLRRTARRFPDHDAVVFPALKLRWNWAEVDRRVDAVARWFISLGIEHGEHVGIWSMNCPEWVITQFAVARIGAVLVNINPAYRLHELEETLTAADVVTLVVGCPFKSSNFEAMVEDVNPEIARSSSPNWTSTRLPVLRRVIAIDGHPGPGWLAWSSHLHAEINVGELQLREQHINPTDIFNIQFTSGTTGVPKGAMLTHRNLLMNAYYIGQRVQYTEADRVCVPVPFYHCFGCVLGTTVCLVYGSALVVPAPTFDPEATLKAIVAEHCTSIYGVPTMFVGELEHSDRIRYDTSSLRTGIMAGSPCPLPLMKAVTEILGAREITIGYGLTEASPIITQTSADDPIEVRVGTVGRVLPGVEVRIVHPITRETMPSGEPGELCARGHGIMAGYYRNPEATARVIDSDGWLSTGDLALVRPDGNYRIVGRSKELIIRGGENIYPPEVEEFLHHHPGVSEVAVVGLPDAKYGEVISAWIVPKAGVVLTAELIREFCKGQIAHFKVPHYIEIVEALPRTVTGKVRKHILREVGIERFGLTESGQIPTA